MVYGFLSSFLPFASRSSTSLLRYSISRKFSTQSFSHPSATTIRTSPIIRQIHQPTKDNILQILTINDAKSALQVLYQHPEVFWACDTEVADIDVKTQGPIGNGRVICMSIYGGPHINFGNGKGSVLWIENINNSTHLLQEFKPWLEDVKYKKVWHNYGFDRHVLYNEGINCLGFGG